jgi:hypothetical protein
MDRNSHRIHKQTHLDDRIGAVLFGNTFFLHFVLFVNLKVVVCYIVVYKFCRSAVESFNLVMEMDLQVILVLGRECSTSHRHCPAKNPYSQNTGLCSQRPFF